MAFVAEPSSWRNPPDGPSATIAVAAAHRCRTSPTPGVGRQADGQPGPTKAAAVAAAFGAFEGYQCGNDGIARFSTHALCAVAYDPQRGGQRLRRALTKQERR